MFSVRGIANPLHGPVALTGTFQNTFVSLGFMCEELVISNLHLIKPLFFKSGAASLRVRNVNTEQR